MLKLAVLASGSGSNFQAIIEAVNTGYVDAEIKILISDKPDAYALTRAKNAGIPRGVISPKDYPDKVSYDLALAKMIRDAGGEVVALAGYMRLVSAEFLQEFPNKVLNIHPALLPSFPGLHGQRQAFEYGVKISGCTVHFVDSGMDSGPIIVQAQVSVLDDDTEETLAARILEQEHKIYPYALKKLAENKLIIKGRKVHVLE